MSTDVLASLREQITQADSELLTLIAKRQKLTAQVAETKVKHQLSVRDKTREEQLLVRLIKQGRDCGLDPHFITKLFQVIIEDSVLQQQTMLHEWANPDSRLPLNRVAFLGKKGPKIN